MPHKIAYIPPVYQAQASLDTFTTQTLAPDFQALKDITKILLNTGTAALASQLLDPDPNGILMSEVNKITYRTPDYMLSSAQNFRPGEKGYQQHIWQATLGSYAVVFTNNPDSLRADDKHRPSF